MKSLVSQSDQDLMSETDAELLSEQISMALGRLEAIPELIAAFSNDTTQSGDARWLCVGKDVRYATPDDPTDLEFWVSAMEPADALADALWGKIGACVLTSATLAHQGEFEAPAGTLGVPIKSGLIVDGAFHYQSQGRLVIPKVLEVTLVMINHMLERNARYLRHAQKNKLESSFCSQAGVCACKSKSY